jgi:Flavodoxin domain
MKAVVLYESSFGNTRQVALAIGLALSEHDAEVEVCSVDDLIPELADVDLLVVGAPTHVHGLSSERSRRAAIEQGAGRSEPGIGVRGFFAQSPMVMGVRAAAFDTRIDRSPILTGSAARSIAKRLERAGAVLVAQPESFFVATGNTLLPGELERAGEWAAALTETAALVPV